MNPIGVYVLSSYRPNTFYEPPCLELQNHTLCSCDGSAWWKLTPPLLPNRPQAVRDRIDRARTQRMFLLQRFQETKADIAAFQRRFAVLGSVVCLQSFRYCSLHLLIVMLAGKCLHGDHMSKAILHLS